MNPTFVPYFCLSYLGDITPERDKAPDAAFIATVSSQGILNPVWLNETDKGFQMIAGRKRLMAARIVQDVYLNRNTIPAFVWQDLTPEQVATLALLENKARSDNVITDTIAVMQLQGAGLTPAQITQATAIHPATLQAYNKYDALLPKFHNAWVKDLRIATPVADLLVRCTAEEQVALWEQYLLNGQQLTAQAVKDTLAARPVAPKVEKKATPPPWFVTVRETLMSLLSDVIPAEGELAGEIGGKLQRAITILDQPCEAWAAKK